MKVVCFMCEYSENKYTYYFKAEGISIKFITEKEIYKIGETYELKIG